MGCVNNKKTQIEPSTSRNLRKSINRKTGLYVSRNVFLKVHYGGLPSTYTCLNQIKTGAFSQIKRCFHTPTQQYRAVKRIDKRGIQSHQYINELVSQIEILRRLDHPNILKPFEFFQDQTNFYIVTELCEGGDLFERILKDGSFTEQTAAFIMKQLLQVIHFCHSQDIVHRDLKPQNILFDSPDSFNIKLSDFGSSVLMDSKRKILGCYGSAYYIAPEVLQGAYNQKCDIWSSGILLYILLTGCPPYQGNTQQEILNNVKSRFFDIQTVDLTSISIDGQKFLKSLLFFDPNARISAQTALTHTWLLKWKPPKRKIGSILSKLQKFARKNKLAQAVRIFCATQISNNYDAKELKQAFAALDTNGDGKLSQQQLFSFYRYAVSPQEATSTVKKIIKAIDRDGSGYIDYSEFIQASLQEANLISAELLQHAFNQFDIDRNGKIDFQELKRVLEGYQLVDQGIWEQIVKEVDLNGDGEIDIEELAHIISNSF